MPQLRKFAPFVKVDEGSHMVWGVATSEVPDKEGEICDYEAAKSAFKAWTEDFLAKTTAAGQDPSLGNIRVMHQLEVGGKVVKVEYKDDSKQVWIGTEPASDAIWKLIKGGFLTGYSIGGSYDWVRPEGEFKRFAPVIAETSYVDNPCNPDASFAYIKADGSIEMRKFAVAKGKKSKRVAGEDLPASAFAYVGDPDKTETWKLPIKFSDDAKTKRHVRNALARFGQTKGIPAYEKDKVHARILAAAKEHGIDTEGEDKSKKALAASALEKLTAAGLAKGMWEVGQLAELLAELSWLRNSAIYEREFEGDESTLPEDLQADLESLIETFSRMAEEETKELAATGAESQGGMFMSQSVADLKKAAKSIHEHLQGLKKAHEDAKEAHDKHHAKVSEHIEKVTKAVGAVAEGDGSEGDKSEKAANGDDIQKMIDAAIEKAMGQKLEPVAAKVTLVPREGQAASDESVSPEFSDLVSVE